MSNSKRFSALILTGLFGAAIPLVSLQAATYTPQEQANMKIVADFYAALDQGNLKERIRGIAEQYLQEDYIQHSALGRAAGEGRQGFIRSFQQVPSGPPPGVGAPPPAGNAGPPPAGAALPNGQSPRAPAKVFILTAQGDLVVRVSAFGMPVPGGDGANSVIFNMFRIQDGKLAEHWDSTTPDMMPGGKPPGSGGPSSAVDKPR